MEPLFEPGKEKNYNAQIGGLAEIIDWSREFYDLYFDKINNWEMFKYSKHNIYNAVILDDLIIAFGKARIIKFYAENKSLENYFLEKYLAVIKGDYQFSGANK